MNGLLIANIPYDCQEPELREWMEAKGCRVSSLRLISDLVTGTSPLFAQVQLWNAGETAKLARCLDGQPLRGRVLRAKTLDFQEIPQAAHPPKAVGIGGRR